MTRIPVFSAILLLVFNLTSANAEEADDAAGIFGKLQQGGYVILMRHANSPSGQLAPVGLSEGCELQPGRGLDARGVYQARAIGEILREKGAPILKAYTSPMCRAWDTAALASGGAPVIADDAQTSTDPAAIAAFKKRIELELAANPGQNILFSNHSNVAPLYGAFAREGEEEVPSGATYIVDPRNWTALARIKIDVTSAQAAAIEFPE